MKYIKTWEKGSFTVESSLVMPVVLACIFLILVMNFYLHDQVVLDSLVTELIHGNVEPENVESEFEGAVKGKTLIIKSASGSYKNSLYQQTLQWKKNLTLPIYSFLQLILDTPEISLAGKGNSYEWNMTSALRTKQALEKGGE